MSSVAAFSHGCNSLEIGIIIMHIYCVFVKGCEQYKQIDNLVFSCASVWASVFMGMRMRACPRLLGLDRAMFRLQV